MINFLCLYLVIHNDVHIYVDNSNYNMVSYFEG